ncbi:MAG: 2-C-methyl-D-erythritol 4-phosphate cytidylyltransferase [Clostridia bacterium]|nr:2-C-methyl-D-erythritol 4-phosphate cytidylyltransferase [Clostridia bacterium]
MVYAAVLAGGSGLRMGGNMPKQFLSVGDKPIIIRSIEAFLSSGSIDKVFVAVSSDFLDYTRELIAEYIGDNYISVVVGGKNRNETLLNVLRSIGEINDDDVILTHDAVRPFIDKRIIDENISAASEYGACNTVVPAVDTILRSSDGKFIESVPVRSEIFHAQTPQSFSVKKLLSLYENLSEDEMETFTDSCSVFLAAGERVFLVTGDRNNIKLTYPEDMERAENIIKCKEDK